MSRREPREPQQRCKHNNGSHQAEACDINGEPAHHYRCNGDPGTNCDIILRTVTD